MIKELDGRVATVEVERLFLERWSPRSFTDEPVPPAHLAAMLEAARWAPSAMNEQPWLFIYATEPESRRTFASLLVEGNRSWAARAPLLLFLFARRRSARSGEPNGWAEFDCGAAWLSFALQARLLGYHTHAMAGFVEEQVYPALGVDAGEWRALAAIAVGRRGPADALPAPLRAREAPNQRAPLDERSRPFGASARCIP